MQNLMKQDYHGCTALQLELELPFLLLDLPLADLPFLDLDRPFLDLPFLDFHHSYQIINTVEWLIHPPLYYAK